MAPFAPLRPADPRTLGGLRLLGRLGEGGQGVVYLAESADGGKAAVKWLRADLAGDESSVQRFLREVEVARHVAPFCTAAVLGTGIEQDRPYIVSEFIEGRSLHRVVQEEGPRTGTALHRLAVGTATALAAIHQAGIVHRDFKPANVIIGSDGPRVIDFGIARALNTTTISQSVVGTPSYMAPEQFMGHAVGPAADLFSWAGTMIYAATGQAPFGNDTMPAVINRVLNLQPDLGARRHAARGRGRLPGQGPGAAAHGRAGDGAAAAAPGVRFGHAGGGRRGGIVRPLPRPALSDRRARLRSARLGSALPGRAAAHGPSLRGRARAGGSAGAAALPRSGCPPRDRPPTGTPRRGAPAPGRTSSPPIPPSSRPTAGGGRWWRASPWRSRCCWPPASS